MPTSTTGIATEFINFTRASNATVTDSDGKIKWAPHNLLLASESFDSSSWSKAASTVTANTTVAPNGLTTADTFKEDNTTSQHQITQSLTVPIGIVTFRVYAKLGSGTRYLQMRPSGLGTGVAYVNFDLSSGVVVPSGSGGTALVSASVTPSTNGFYLCEMVANFASAPSGMMFQLSNGTTENTSYTGDNTSSIILWGAHLYRSDLGGMQANTSAYPMYNPTTPKNLMGYTEDFSNAYWAKAGLDAFGSGSIANSILAPNGLQTADLISVDTGTTTHRLIGTAVTVPSGTPVVQSVYLKAGTHTFMQLHDGVSASYFANFNLANGTTGTVTGCTAAISLVGDGWYRCSISMTLNVANPLMCIAMVTSATAPRNETWTPTGNENFYVWGAQLSDSASLDTYSPVYGAAVTSAAYYGPRRDFDPVSLACKGLLVEEQRTNLLTYSAQFDNAAWVKSGLNTSGTPAWVNVAVAPDGTTTAEKLIADATAGIHHVSINASSTAAGHTTSVFAKEGEYRYATVCRTSGGGIHYAATVDLRTGLVTQETVSGSTTYNTVTTNYGNGWWRIQSYSNATSGHYVLIGISDTATYTPSSNGMPSFTGDGTSGIYIWGAQYELGSFATSYIPTGAATATRNADVASVSTQAFPYSSSEGTLVANVQRIGVTSNADEYAGVELSTGAVQANSISLYYDYASNDRPYMFLFSPTGTLTAPNGAAGSSPNYSVGEAAKKIGGAYKSGDSAVSINGTIGTTNTTALTLANPTRLKLSSATDTAIGSFNGYVRQVTYIPRRLTNAELQSRTA